MQPSKIELLYQKESSISATLSLTMQKVNEIIKQFNACFIPCSEPTAGLKSEVSDIQKEMSRPEHTCGLNFYCHGCYNLGYGQGIMDSKSVVPTLKEVRNILLTPEGADIRDHAKDVMSKAKSEVSEDELEQDIAKIVGELAGSASMCWKPIPSDQVFNSSLAEIYVKEAVAAILNRINRGGKE